MKQQGMLHKPTVDVHRGEPLPGLTKQPGKVGTSSPPEEMLKMLKMMMLTQVTQPCVADMLQLFLLPAFCIVNLQHSWSAHVRVS